MDLNLLKEWAPTISTVAVTCLVPLVKLAWDIRNDLRDLKKEFKENNEILKSHDERLEVHDKLAATVFAKPISSKLISEGRQEWPHFRKPVRDN